MGAKVLKTSFTSSRLHPWWPDGSQVHKTNFTGSIIHSWWSDGSQVHKTTFTGSILHNRTKVQKTRFQPSQVYFID